jgi:cellulose synthase/poly-beta-1,6-N-acetylglucosamine synthase-like glycosyltransferase
VELVVIALKIYLSLTAVIMLIYFVRHFIFTLNRLVGKQRIYYQDILDSELPHLSVFIPMHNEEKVASDILDRLIAAEYPIDKLEIIPINDHSTDRTKKIINAFARRYPHIKPLHRNKGKRGKPAGLNEAMQKANGEIAIVFDADYLPPRGILRDMAVAFKDPEVGAMMGRVIPINTAKNLLTRLLDLERSAGYQIDQQARYNLKLIPQYGGTVGGYRRDQFLSFGGFDENVLAEDTELTYRFFIQGWKVVYASRVECYEEVPEQWETRARQIKRWARGHTQVMFKYLWPMLRSSHITRWEKIDGALLLFIYAVPFLITMGIVASLVLFFLGEMQIVESLFLFMLVVAYNTFGNIAPFNQLGMAALIDGTTYRIHLIPLLFFVFLFNLWNSFLGFTNAAFDVLFKRDILWQKTERFRSSTGKAK